MNRNLALTVIAISALALTACEPFGDKDKEALKKDCGAAPATLSRRPAIPNSFPDAQGIKYTSIKKDGPSTIVSGYLDDAIGPAHQAYHDALTNASGWAITKEEQDAADSEVNFAGHTVSGQVKMIQICKGRTTVAITIRPA